MSIRFAGSKSVDDRRRRRLAQEADAPPESPPARRTARSAASRAEPEEARLPQGSSPADSLISPKLWQHAVVGVLALLAWASMLAVGDCADRVQTGFEQIIGLRAGHLARFFSTVMLLAAGQLAFINLWYRSRSRKDFSGSYKVWFYTAVGWLTLCAFAATGSHWNLADAVIAGRPLAIWNGRLLLWLIPGAIIVLSLYRLLSREMRDCASSTWLLRISGVLAGGAAVALVLGPFFLSARWQLLGGVGLATAWHMMLALSMLLHARHVIHECNEPPCSPIRRWRLRLAWPLGRCGTANTRKTGKTSQAKAKVQDGSSRAASQGRSTTKVKRKTTRRTSRRETSAGDDEDPEGTLDEAHHEAVLGATPDEVAPEELDETPEPAPASRTYLQREAESLRGGRVSQSAGNLAASQASGIQPAAAGRDVGGAVRSSASAGVSGNASSSGGSARPVANAAGSSVTRRVDPPDPALRGPKAGSLPASSSQVDDEESESQAYGDDDGDTRDLSKKERRRLRKLQRQSGR